MSWRLQNSQQGGVGRWLAAQGSLSARLAATGSVFSVQVLKQGRSPLTRDEAQALGVTAQCTGYAREVILRVDGQAMVFARSVTPHADALGAWRAVQGLGTRPLADVLFKRAGIARQALQFNQFKPHTPVQRHVAQAWHAATGLSLVRQSLPARRSVFIRLGAPLLVMEVFAAPKSAWRWPGQRLDQHQAAERAIA
jgi:chorismate--pyruvate lyase